MNGQLEAPKHLSDRSRGLWAEIVPKRVESPGRLVLLQLALESLDTADKCRETLEKEGLTIKTESSGAVHVHPLTRVEKEARQLFVRCWRELRLSYDDPFA